jgi:polyisoprenoid-binding protein YceI
MKHLLLVLLMVFGSPLFAADYLFDKTHTQIFFNVDHLGFSTSTGAFTGFEGGFSFDPDNVEQASVEVIIQTSSIDLNDDKWNSHMRAAKWFDAEQFPTMTFKSTEVIKTGEKTIDMVGDFTLKGVTKPVILKVVLNKIGQQFGKDKIGFSATVTIDRLDFGMDANAKLIGTQIPISIAVEGIKVP